MALGARLGRLVRQALPGSVIVSQASTVIAGIDPNLTVTSMVTMGDQVAGNFSHNA